MAEWLGHLLANFPLWVIVSVGSVVAVIGALLYILPIGYELPGPKSEWQKSWYKKNGKKNGKN